MLIPRTLANGIIIIIIRKTEQPMLVNYKKINKKLTVDIVCFNVYFICFGGLAVRFQSIRSCTYFQDPQIQLKRMNSLNHNNIYKCISKFGHKVFDWILNERNKIWNWKDQSEIQRNILSGLTDLSSISGSTISLVFRSVWIRGKFWSKAWKENLKLGVSEWNWDHFWIWVLNSFWS